MDRVGERVMNTDDVVLVKVRPCDEVAVNECKQEFFDNNEEKIPGSSSLVKYNTFNEWYKIIKNFEDDEYAEKFNMVPAVQYLLKRKADGKLLGFLQIRERLNEKLSDFAGHFGGAIRPSERNKGYSTKMIKLGVKKAKKFGIEKVLISCLDTNFASARSIEKAGGVYEKTFIDEKEKAQYKRFWIDVK